MCSLPKLSFTALDSIPVYMWIFKVEFADTIFATYSLPADSRESNDKQFSLWLLSTKRFMFIFSINFIVLLPLKRNSFPKFFLIKFRIMI